MARDLGPACRRCRREGIKLMLKGSRCSSAKCPMEKPSRNAPPGAQRAFRRGQGSEYGKRLRETQKLKRYYGLFDKQFRRYFREAQRSKENTGDALLNLLQRRLDNVVCKLGFAPSRRAARVAVGHGHFTVNGARVTKPGYLVEVGDIIGVRKREASQKMVRSFLESNSGRDPQKWLKVDEQALEGTVLSLPALDDVGIPVETQLVIEFASR